MNIISWWKEKYKNLLDEFFFPSFFGGSLGDPRKKKKSKIVASSLDIISVRLPAHVSISSVHNTPKSRRGWFHYSTVSDGGSFQSDGL
jgi:hypothetical protein